jgi:hypothetical protein
MEDLSLYPLHCRQNIRKIMSMLNTDAETAYNMIRMTATLMDLRTNDERVVRAILMDCDIGEVGERA